MDDDPVICGLCGKEVIIGEDTKVLVLTDALGLVYHPECWDLVLPRVAFITHVEELLLLDVNKEI